MQDAMAIIQRGLQAFQTNEASQTLGLNGLGTIASEEMKAGVKQRKKNPGLDPTQYGLAAADLLS